MIKLSHAINESSLSRIWKHSEEHDVAIITAFRGKNVNCVHTKDDKTFLTKSDNKLRNNELYAALLKMRYGVTSVNVVYQEEGQAKTKESPIFVVNLKDSTKFKEDMTKLGEYYCQDYIFYKPRGGEAILYGTNNAKKDAPGLHNTQYVKDFYEDRDGEAVFRGRPKPGTEMFWAMLGNKAFVFSPRPKPKDKDKKDIVECCLDQFDNLQIITKWIYDMRSQKVLRFINK